VDVVAKIDEQLLENYSVMQYEWVFVLGRLSRLYSRPNLTVIDTLLVDLLTQPNAEAFVFSV